MRVCDAHTDFLTTIKDKTERENHVKSIKKIAGIISCAVFTTNSTICLKDVENFKHELETYNKKYNTKFLLSIEDLGFIKSVKELNQLINLEPFSVTLTWNFKNQFGGGANTNRGLTRFGIKVIKILEEKNILIDTAHLSRKAFFQFAKITTKPIYNSHSNIDLLHEHKRNLTDKQIKKIVDSNGFLGLTVFQKFISNNNITTKDIALQFQYIIKKFGSKYCGLGTDFYGVNENLLPINFQSYFDLEKLKSDLIDLGCSKQVINNLIYRNYENFTQKIFK
jgi:membrane dipeptidase